MSDKLVPIDKLPPEARAMITPEHPAFKIYATQFEKQRGLKPGTLTGARYEFSPGTDMLEVLTRAADDAVKNPSPDAPAAPREKVKVPTLKELNAQMLAEESWPKRMLIGAGKSVADIGRGIGQMTGQVSQREVDDAARRDQALMDDTAGFVGNIAGSTALGGAAGAGLRGVGALAKAAPYLGGTGRMLASPYGNAAAAGAVLSGAQPVETGGSRAAQAGLGAATSLGGQAAASGLNAMVQPATRYASDQVKHLAQRAKELGIPLRAADVSPNPVLSVMQKGADYLPLSGGNVQRGQAGEAFNRALAKTMGEDTDDLLAALKNTKTRTGDTYDQLAARNSAELDPVRHGAKMLDAWKEFRRTDTSPNKSVSASLDEYLNALFDPAAGLGKINQQTGKFELTGELYKKFRSEARELGQKAAKQQDAQLQRFYQTVKETLDDAMRTSSRITPEDKALYKLTDKQYGNMKTLSSLAPTNSTGDYDFNRLAQVMMGRNTDNVYNRNAMIYGGGDQTLPDLARIGTTFLGRGEQPRWAGVANRVKELGPTIALGPAAGGIYALNATQHDKGGAEALTDTALELGALLAASKAGGSMLNSRWFLEGLPRAAKGLGALEAAGLAHAGTGALNAQVRSALPPDGEEDR